MKDHKYVSKVKSGRGYRYVYKTSTVNVKKPFKESMEYVSTAFKSRHAGNKALKKAKKLEQKSKSIFTSEEKKKQYKKEAKKLRKVAKTDYEVADNAVQKYHNTPIGKLSHKLDQYVKKKVFEHRYKK